MRDVEFGAASSAQLDSTRQRRRRLDDLKTHVARTRGEARTFPFPIDEHGARASRSLAQIISWLRRLSACAAAASASAVDDTGADDEHADEFRAGIIIRAALEWLLLAVRRDRSVVVFFSDSPG